MGQGVSAAACSPPWGRIPLLSLPAVLRSVSGRVVLRDRSHGDESAGGFQELWVHAARREGAGHSPEEQDDGRDAPEEPLRPSDKGLEQFQRPRAGVRLEFQYIGGLASGLHSNEHGRREQLSDAGDQYQQ